VGTVGIYELYTRLSFVCYLREKILNCPDVIDPEYLYGIEDKKKKNDNIILVYLKIYKYL